MARISTYVIDGTIVDDDKVIGSDANNSMITKNYTVRDLAAYIGHSIGNNSFVPYINANNDVNLGAYSLTTTNLIIGNQLFLGGSAGLPGQVPISNGSGSPAFWGYNIGTQTLRDVLNQGNTGNKNLILSNTTSSTIALDLEKLYGANVGLYVFDNLLNSSSSLFPNKLDVQESSLQKTASYSASGIRYSNNGNNVDVRPTNYSNQTLSYPSNSGVLVTSVNNITADSTGNIILSGLGLGTVTSVAVTPGTGISASVVDASTTPNITITNTAPDQVVVLNEGAGIDITGTYPSFTIAATGSVTTPTLQEVLAAGNISENNLNITLYDSAGQNNFVTISPTTGFQYANDLVNGDGSQVNGDRLYIYKNLLGLNPKTVELSHLGLTYSFTDPTGTESYIGILNYPNYVPDGTIATNTVYLPLGDGNLALKVNGVGADVNGAITIPVGTGDVTGTGTTNFVPKWSSSSALTDSIIQQIGNDVVEINSNSGGLSTILNLNTLGVSATATIISFKQNNIERYQITKAGNNDFRIIASNNLGSYLGDPFKITANTLNVTLESLGGVGTRMVVASSAGVLSTQTIPSGGGGLQHGIASGTDTYTVTISGVTSYAEGDSYIVRFTNGNTTGATLNINGLGVVPLYRNNDGPLLGGDILNNGDMLCVYDTSIPAFRVIGTSPNSLFAYVTNDDSVTITKGQVVYAFSGQGDRMTVKLANNVGDSTSAQTVGLVFSTSIAANAKGLIIMQGLLDGLSILPTATWNDGDPVYLGATAGSITPTKQYAPAHLVYLGFVTTASNGTAGRMYVRIQNGYELDELHNVQARTPTLKDTLWYDNTVSPAQWKTASIPTILGYTPVGGTGTNNEIAYFTAGSTIASLPTATYPSLTQLSYVKGVTSAIQTQLDSKGYTLSLTSLASNLATGSTYYFGNVGRSMILNTPDVSRVYIPKTGVIKKAYITQYSGAQGTITSITVSIRLNNTTDTLVAVSTAASVFRTYNNNALSINVTEGDYIEIKVTSVSSVAPTANVFGGTIYIE